jgi:hypothetical protein
VGELIVANYIGDQPTLAPYVTNGVTASATAAALNGVANEAPTYVFSAPWTQIFNCQTLSFRVGIPYSLDAALLAALQAASAPIVSA